MSVSRSVTAAFKVKADVDVEGKLRGYGSVVKRIHFYAKGTDVRYTGWVTPDRSGHPLRIVWQKHVSGVWKTISASTVTIGSTGRAHRVISSAALHRGVTYRIRCRYQGDVSHRSGQSPWSYFGLIRP